MVSLAAFVVVMAGAMASVSIITPMLLAFFISVIAIQPVLWLTERKVNHAIAVLIVLLGIIGIFVDLAAVLGNSVNSFAEDAPLYANKLKDIGSNIVQAINERGINIPDEWDGALNPASVLNYTANILTEFGALMGNALLVLFIILFMPLRRHGCPQCSHERAPYPGHAC